MQNAVRFGAKCSAFWGILRSLLMLIADISYYLRLNSAYKYLVSLTLFFFFCGQTNSRENRFFAHV